MTKNLTIHTFKRGDRFMSAWRRRKPSGGFTDWSPMIGPYDDKRAARNAAVSLRDDTTVPDPVKEGSRMITVDDLLTGASFNAPNQGTAITPRTVRVKVVSLHGDDVWYELPPMRAVKTTTVERFLNIVNGRGKL